MIVLGLTGRAGCGKSTVARYLVEQYGFKEISFAAPLYAGVSAIFGVPEHTLRDRDNKEREMPELCGFSPREVLQKLGTEWGRIVMKPTLWLEIAGRKVARAQACGHQGVVVSDVRFDNEAEWILDLSGLIWNIQRPVKGPHLVRAHESERGVNFDIIPNDRWQAIINATGFPDLYARVDELMALQGAPQ